MKTTLTALALWCAASLALGQSSNDPNNGNPPSNTPPSNTDPTNPGNDVMPPDIEPRPELPEETRELMQQHREQQQVIREARLQVVEDYLAENPDATAEEIRMQIEQWNEVNAELIEAQQALREDIREDLKEIADNAIPEDIREDMGIYRDTAQQIREGRRAAVEGFLNDNPDATPEQVREVVQAYNLENAEVIAANQQLRREIRQDLRDLRDGPTPMSIQNRRQEIRQVANQLSVLRETVREQLQEPEANRQAIIEQFRSDRRAILDSAKEEFRDNRANDPRLQR